MIVVLADDYSGAAEIAGIAHRFGFITKLITEYGDISETEILVIDTDTRSCSKETAIKKLQNIIPMMSNIEIDWMYKKLDSVLRGHVLAEINQILDETNFSRAIMVPANPSKGRIIKNRTYLIDGIPIDQTDFAYDPEFPAKSSNLSELLRSKKNKYDVHIVSTDEKLPDAGVIVSEINQSSDLKRWADSLSDSTIPCGGSDFFISILDQKTGKSNKITSSKAHRVDGLCLYVVGSIADRDELEIVECPIPCNLSSCEELTQECQENWQDQLGMILCDKKSVAMVVDQIRSIDLNIPVKLKKLMASVVRDICQRYEIDNLIISGGSTASEIVKALGLHEMSPVFEYDTGVVSLRASQTDKPIITVKPGSYPWPAGLIN